MNENLSLPNPPTPGWQTSEWWITIAMMIVGILVTLGVITAQDKQQAESWIGPAVTAVFTLIATASAAWRYIQSREAIKVEQMVSMRFVQMESLSLESERLEAARLETIPITVVHSYHTKEEPAEKAQASST